MEPAINVLTRICRTLQQDEVSQAASVVRNDLPFKPPADGATRHFSNEDALRIFMRDRFTDRYSGDRLVFPGSLRLLSALLPAEFPYHPNWKTTECHQLYWLLFPTVDHVEPIARGGRDEESNWVTTSMMRNSAKGPWTLQELGWQVLPLEDLTAWDGLLGWFKEFVDVHPDVLQNAGVREWQRTVKKVCDTTTTDPKKEEAK